MKNWGKKGKGREKNQEREEKKLPLLGSIKPATVDFISSHKLQLLFAKLVLAI